jgi:hypothetical protein
VVGALVASLSGRKAKISANSTFRPDRRRGADGFMANTNACIPGGISGVLITGAVDSPPPTLTRSSSTLENSA